MKQINVYFEDDDHKALTDKKGDLSWKEFILKMLDGYDETK